MVTSNRTGIFIFYSQQESTAICTAARVSPPRLEDFDVVNLQPLDKRRQRAMIEDRLSTDQVGTFLEQLEAAAGVLICMRNRSSSLC
jgi:hypothetical protein